MKTSSRWLITLAACLVVVAALAAFKVMQIRAAIAFGKSFPEPSATVEATTAVPGRFATQVQTLGEVVAPQALELRNEVEGRIAAVNFASGDKVEADAVLVQLDISEESARLKAALARLELARLNLDRLERLLTQQTVSEDLVDKARAEAAITAAEVEALRAIIAKKTLRAPFAAVAGLHQLTPGEFLQANTLVASLVGVNDFTWVDFNLPLAQAGVAVGTEVEVRHGGAAFSGEVIARDASASATSRNLRLRARVAGGQVIPANAVVEVEVPTGTREQLLIPATALLKDAMGDYVYVLNPEPAAKGYRAERRTLTLTGRDETTASVAAGLADGELVATQGAFKLRQGLLAFVGDSGGAAALDATP
jgi:membrane fusion protein (multidrug efflux system)